MTDPRPICPACGGRPYLLDAIGWSCRAWFESPRLAELEAQLAHAQGEAASSRTAYEAVISRLSGVQTEADDLRRERDRAQERIRELELAAPMAREAGR